MVGKMSLVKLTSQVAPHDRVRCDVKVMRKDQLGRAILCICWKHLMAVYKRKVNLWDLHQQ